MLNKICYAQSNDFIGFVGRAVMLEQPRKSGTKVISHMLASHGGEIFIHAINTARSLLEDPPSISEGCGGRVTDYRINVSNQQNTSLSMLDNSCSRTIVMPRIKMMQLDWIKCISIVVYVSLIGSQP